MAGEWGRVSHKCQWAHGGGTCLEALLQVTPACVGDWTRQPPEAPSSLGSAGGRERWLLPRVPEQGQGQPGAGRGVGACPTAVGAMGQGSRGQARPAAVSCRFKARSHELPVKAPGRKPLWQGLCWGEGPVRWGGLCRVCPAPVSWCLGAPLQPHPFPSAS